MNQKNNIKYLPFFYKDLEEITDYMLYNLKNPIAAEKFINKVEKEIKEIIKL